MKPELPIRIDSTRAAFSPGAQLLQIEGGCRVLAANPRPRSSLRILKKALETPTRQIAENSSLDGGVVVDRMRSCKGNCGLDASTGKYVDLMEAGIIDAIKVVRVALENAVSVASTLLLTEATLTEIREVKPAMPSVPDLEP